jgi:hypothetical protein
MKTLTGRRKIAGVVLVLLVCAGGAVYLQNRRSENRWACESNSIDRVALPASFTRLPKETQADLVAQVARSRGKFIDQVEDELATIWATTTYEWLLPATKERIEKNLDELQFGGPRPKTEIANGTIRITNREEMLQTEIPMALGAITTAVGQVSDVDDLTDSKNLTAFSEASFCTTRR